MECCGQCGEWSNFKYNYQGLIGKAISNFQFLDNINDHVAIVFSVNYLDNSQPTTQQYESHYDYRHADILSLKYPLSDIKSEELLSDSPAINDMLTTFLDTFVSVCSKCVPTNRRHNGNYVKYPNYIGQLRRKCIYTPIERKASA